MIIFGFHWALAPLVMNSLAVNGFDNIFPVTLATNFAIAGCVLGIFLKTKNKELKEVTGSSFVSAFVAGVTEPAVYGAVLKFKRPYVIVCILDAIGGVIMASIAAKQTVLLTTSALTLPAMIAMMGPWVIVVSCIGFFGGAILTYLFGYSDKMLEK